MKGPWAEENEISETGKEETKKTEGEGKQHANERNKLISFSQTKTAVSANLFSYEN